MLRQRKPLYPFLFFSNCTLGFNCQMWSFEAELFWSWESVYPYAGARLDPTKDNFLFLRDTAYPPAFPGFWFPRVHPRAKMQWDGRIGTTSPGFPDKERLSWGGQAGGVSGAASIPSTHVKKPRRGENGREHPSEGSARLPASRWVRTHSMGLTSYTLRLSQISRDQPACPSRLCSGQRIGPNWWPSRPRHQRGSSEPHH